MNRRLIVLLVLSLTLTGSLFCINKTLSAREMRQGNDDPIPSQQRLVVEEVELTLPLMNAAIVQVEPAAFIMSENFEGNWPAAGWKNEDRSTSDGGEYFLGKRDCHPRTGSFAGWAAGGGAQGSARTCTDNYPNNLDSWAIYGPFDLSNATKAGLNFYFWGITEIAERCASDQLYVASSTDGQKFSGQYFCGDWRQGDAGNGYYQYTLDLSKHLGKNQVWIGIAFKSNGSVTFNGMAIDDATLDVNTNTQPQGIAKSLMLSYVHTCALISDGGVKCWGGNNDGELGNGTTDESTIPVDVIGLNNKATAITLGFNYTCALVSDGKVQCWGVNTFGELGDGTTMNRTTATEVHALTGVSTVAASNSRSLVVGVAGHTCALTGGGGVKCWGSNLSGQLGDGTTTDRSTPVDVIGLSNGVTAIATNKSSISIYSGYSCALMSSGGVKCWGGNGNGQLGDGTTTNSSTPVDVVGVAESVSISLGRFHACTLINFDRVKCWGDNSYGQLGDGTTMFRPVPVEVSGLSNITSLQVSNNRSCALTNSGDVKCWGDNSLVPVGAVGVSQATAVAMGDSHTCALISDGSVKCWGNNYFGQLGDGTTTSRLTPVTVLGVSHAIAIAANSDHSCALMSDGGVKCWGRNRNGVLGDGTMTDRSIAVDVIGLGGGMPTYSISGRVTDANNNPIPDVTITAAGPTIKSITTDSSGNYVLNELAAGKYELTPFKKNYTFVPPLFPVTLPPDAMGINFNATAASINLGITIILAEPSDERHTNNHDRSYYEKMFQSIRSYYDENSMQHINLTLASIYDNGGSWYKLSKTHKEYASDPLGFVRQAEQMALGTTTIPRNTIAIVVHAGSSRQAKKGIPGIDPNSYIDTHVLTPSDNPNVNEIIVSEHDQVGPWVHEIGHSLGIVLVDSVTPDLYRMGSVSAWDVMALGSYNGGNLCNTWLTQSIYPLLCDGSNPPHMSSFTKEFLQFLKYQRIDRGATGTYWVDLLPRKHFGEHILQYVIVQQDDGTPNKYYVIETRNNSSIYSQWDTSVPDTGLVLYWVDTKGMPKYGTYGNNISQTINQVAVLKPPGLLRKNKYVDLANMLTFNVLNERTEGANYDIQLEISTPAPDPIWRAGVVLQPDGKVATDIAPWYSISGPSPYLQLEPDLDLHVYDEDGRHVGMNYATMQYEIQVAGAVASGNLHNAHEWILLPKRIDYRYIVRSTATNKFLKDNPGAATYTDGKDGYKIYGLVSDPVTGFLTSTTQQVAIGSGIDLEHLVSISENRAETPIQVGPAITVVLPLDAAVAAAGPTLVSPNEIITYNLIFGNSGGTPATGVNLYVRKPNNTDFVSAPGFVSVGNDEYRYQIVNLDVADSIQLMFVVHVNDGLSTGTSVQLQVYIGDDGTHGPDAVPDNNRATVTTHISANLFLPIIARE